MKKEGLPQNAVLFITYNRLDLVKSVLAEIRKYAPKRLYIASDGGKNEEDKKKVQEVRDYLDTSVDWKCDVKRRYSEYNQGCKYGPFYAMDWFFDYEERGVILEDDVCPSADFWKYMDEMLERFSEADTVMIVSGCNIMTSYNSKTRFLFTKYPNYWGWGTWKRAWKYMDIDMAQFPQIKRNHFLKKNFVRNTAFSLQRDFEEVYKGKLDAWDYAFTMAIIVQKGLTVMPAESLVTNLGVNRNDGTHTNNLTWECKCGSLRKELPDPMGIMATSDFDEMIDRDFFKVNFFHAYIKKIIPSILYAPLLQIYHKFKRKM